MTFCFMAVFSACFSCQGCLAMMVNEMVCLVLVILYLLFFDPQFLSYVTFSLGLTFPFSVQIFVLLPWARYRISVVQVEIPNYTKLHNF